MPVYEFRCSECLGVEESLVPMANRNDGRLHSCGAVMKRVMSMPHMAVFKVTNKNRVLDTLNEEARRPVINGGEVRSRRSQQALASGLDYVRPLEEKVFSGF